MWRDDRQNGTAGIVQERQQEKGGMEAECCGLMPWSYVSTGAKSDDDNDNDDDDGGDGGNDDDDDDDDDDDNYDDEDGNVHALGGSTFTKLDFKYYYYIIACD